MTTPPTLRQQALEAAHDTIRDGRWWLPPAGQADVVDAIAAVYEAHLAAILERILDDHAHRTACANQSVAARPDLPELADTHSAMAGGMHIAAARVARGNPALIARIKERIGNPESAHETCEASQRRAVRIQTLLDDTRDRLRKLHRPAHYGGRIICAECSAYDGHSSTDSPPVDHPCPTITALEPPKETPDA